MKERQKPVYTSLNTVNSYQFKDGGGGISWGSSPLSIKPWIGHMLFIAHDFVNMVEVLLFWPAHLACAEGSALQCCSLSKEAIPVRGENLVISYS